MTVISPVKLTINILGIMFQLAIPSSKIWVFLYGVIFWAIMGPIITWFVKHLLEIIGSIIGGTYVKKDEFKRYEGNKTYYNKIGGGEC